MTNLDETWQKRALGQSRQLESLTFEISHQGAKLFGTKDEILAIWQYSGDLILPRGLRGDQRPSEVSAGLMNSVWGGLARHWPTAGVCDQR